MSAGGDYQLTLPRSAIRVLAACANCSKRHTELTLRDPLAEHVFDSLGGCEDLFSASELQETAYRALLIDRLARKFFEGAPGALGVSLWPQLGTRAHRLSDARWADIDLPEVARLRRHLLPERQGWMQLGTSMSDFLGLAAVSAALNQRLFLILDESVLPMSGSTLMRVLDEVSQYVTAGSEIVIAFDSSTPLRRAHPSQASSALELVLLHSPQGQCIARYPRLRFVDDATYSLDVSAHFARVNADAQRCAGVGATAIAHLRFI